MKRTLFWVLGILAVVMVLQAASQSPGKPQEHMTFSELNQLIVLHPEQIKALTFINGQNEVIVQQVGKDAVTVDIPDDGGKQLLIKNAADHGVAMDARNASSGSVISVLLSFFFQALPFLLIGYFLLIMMKGAQNGMSQMGQFGSAGLQKATTEREKVTFDDVAGCEEAKQELEEVVDYLRNPGLLARLGGRPPRGVLLVGPPGNGKTLIARAVAGEAGVPFLAISASEFVQMFVGVGASRVRDLFQQARSQAPCIVFIDEVDAAGRQRGAGLGHANDEREQTLNQILVEMDGFKTDTRIIVIAATNRPDVLDPALVRPGRFDRQVLVDRADLRGREAIFRIHLRGKLVVPDVSPRELARLTPGYSGAEIEGSCNEAATVASRRIKDGIAAKLAERGTFSEVALKAIAEAIIAEATEQPKLAAALSTTAFATSPGGAVQPVAPRDIAAIIRAAMVRQNKNLKDISAVLEELKANRDAVNDVKSSIGDKDFAINRADMVEGIDRVKMGVARTSRAKAMSADELANTATHELGHALVNTLLDGGDPVTKITVMPRAFALGFTQTLPEGDRFNYTQSQLLVNIVMAMGGRAAQEELLGVIDTGAANDFEQSWSFAREMVTKYGMSCLGPISVSGEGTNPFLGREIAVPHGIGSDLANQIDREVRRITNQALELARRLVREHKDFMQAACKELLEKETLLGDDWQSLLKQYGVQEHQTVVNFEGGCLACQTNCAATKKEPEPDAQTVATQSLGATSDEGVPNCFGG